MSSSSSPSSIGGISLPNLNDTVSTIFTGNPYASAVSAAQHAATATPNLKSPDSLSSTPTLAETNTTSIQTQLVAESNAARYGTQLTTGAGLLDQPSTTSRILLGS